MDENFPHGEDFQSSRPIRSQTPVLIPAGGSRRACPEYSERKTSPSDYEDEGEDEEVSKGSIH